MIEGAVTTGEKRIVHLTIRLEQATVEAIDEYVERRSREAKLTLSRAQAIRELLEYAVGEPARARA